VQSGDEGYLLEEPSTGDACRLWAYPLCGTGAMAHKKRGQLSTSPEWARHLRQLAKRWFWKGERRAERDLARPAALGRPGSPSHGTVEGLLSQIDSFDPDAKSAQLWVPESLSLDGRPVGPDVAMAVLGDKLLSENLYPNGFREGEGGRTYLYDRA
jgi:hypothetical protein